MDSRPLLPIPIADQGERLPIVERPGRQMNIVIIGGGGHAKVIIDMIEQANVCRIVGIVDQHLPANAAVSGYPMLGADRDLNRLIAELNIEAAVVAIGDNWIRAAVAQSLMDRFGPENTPSLQFPNVIHPRAQIARDVQIGRGNVFMAGAIVNSATSIGDFCIFNTNCSADHDNIVRDFASFGPKACTGGCVEIGEFSSICLGANVINRIKIGRHTVVGAGATVVRDLGDHVLALGTPARVVRARTAGESYL